MNTTWSKVDSFTGNVSSPALSSHRPCPICGSIRSRLVLALNDFQFFTDSAELPKRVDVHENQCLDCFALYLNPCYSDFGFQILFAEAGQSYGATARRPQEQVEWLAGRGLLQSGMKAIDIGCYDGRFLATLPNHIGKVGVDVDESAIEQGRRQYGEQGIEFVLADLETYRCTAIPDTIMMFHVLEHLRKPVAVLLNLRSIAQPNTRLVVEVPILENGITNDINGFFSVGHMMHFSRHSLKNCLALSGWAIVEWNEQPDYNGCRILAAPCDVDSKVVGAEEDILLLHEYLSAWYKTLHSVNRKLLQLKNPTHCALWGGGLHTEFLYHTTSFFQANRDRRYLIVDSDPIKQGRTWRGIPIHAPSVIEQLDWSQAILVVSSYGSQDTITGAALDSGVPAGRIVKLYDSIRVH